VDEGFVIQGLLDLDPDLATMGDRVNIGLVQLHNSSDGATLGDTLVSTSQISLPEVGHREQWELAVPAQLDDDWLGALDVGVDSGAEFMLGAWIDDDQDWAFDEGEMVVGAREELLVYVAGDPGVDLSAAGYAAGWNQVWRDLLDPEEPGAAQVVDGSAQSELVLTTNLYPRLRTSLHGEVALEGESAAVAVRDYVGFCEEERRGDTFTGAAVVNHEFYIPFAEEPLDTRYDSTTLLDDCGTSGVPIVGVRGAIFDVVSFEDSDGDGNFDTDEDIHISSTGGDSGSVLVYLWPNDFSAVAYLSMGGNMGWGRIAIGGVGLADFVEWEPLLLAE